MKLKNRVFLILVLILFFTLILNFNIVKAVEYDGAFPNFEDLINKTGYSKYCIYKYKDVPHLVLIENSNTRFNCTGTDGYWAGKGNVNNLAKEYILQDNKWIECDFDLSNSYGNFCLIFSRSNSNYVNYIYFNNIQLSINDSNVYSINPIPNDYVFFQIAVVLVEEVQELPGVIAETLKVIIPVGLIVLVVILLIYLIKRVIYLSH